MPDLLLIDISNSFAKISAASREALVGEVSRIPTPRLSPTAIRKAVGSARNFGGVVLSSVVPTAEPAIAAYAGKLTPLLKLSHRVKLGIEVDYPKPATIGADRLANAAGAASFYGAPCVVVDFGTAVTFDVVGGNRRAPAYLGGVIAPGLEAMTHYLHQRTALLPRIDLSEPKRAIGKSTRDAMLSGAIHGYRGLVRQILEELRKELRTRKMKVVATGGYADLIASRLPEIDTVHPHLTLEGLRLIGTLNLLND